MFCTIHTSGAAESVQRFVELFGERNEHVARESEASLSFLHPEEEAAAPGAPRDS